MATLSAADQIYLAGELGQLADQLDQYANDPKSPLSDADRQALHDDAGNLRNAAQPLNDAGAQAAFADADAAFSKISDITHKANEAAHDLANQRAAIAHWTNVAASVVNLGVAIATGGDVWGKATAVLSAVQDSNKQTLGSGAAGGK